MTQTKTNLIITSILGALAIILGAFGAHALGDKLDPQQINNFETGVRYMMYHVIVLLFINSIANISKPLKNRISYLFFGGIFCFSGSLFAITAGGVSAKAIWFITPLGGLLFIIGWILLAFTFFKKSEA